ncbi:hypothetical protein L211DRAFT_684925 [Terfezia boudieri ATCC MYA-4762]|uniref:Uncharacterized protein n=1 Tax=Terfezia boudieri ATCC MYA-4762 TaxID=1051890 RepID=A0A3N4MA91_9PEZI|nr:hypothetical protein L211DRAFT_684925 [Terfezia boudieri ATCC MYA-4762]
MQVPYVRTHAMFCVCRVESTLVATRWSQDRYPQSLHFLDSYWPINTSLRLSFTLNFHVYRHRSGPVFFVESSKSSIRIVLSCIIALLVLLSTSRFHPLQ